MSSLSPRRCPFSRKPETLGEIRFFGCQHCGRIIHELDRASHKAPVCCAHEMLMLLPERAPENFTYEISGGFDNNAVSVHWEGPTPRWILLRTFTSALFKLLSPQKKSPAIFPLADEDAYAYCGREQCQKCMYKCKKGFVIYINSADGRLLEIPLEEMARYFKVVS